MSYIPIQISGNGIVSYHPSVQSVGRSQLPEETVNEVNAPCTKTTETGKIDENIPSVEESLQTSIQKNNNHLFCQQRILNILSHQQE